MNQNSMSTVPPSRGIGEGLRGKIMSFTHDILCIRHPGRLIACPYRDGPALRAIAVMIYANFLLDRGFPSDVSYVQQRIYDPRHLKSPGRVLKNDLEEVAQGWSKGGFDLWEEV